MTYCSDCIHYDVCCDDGKDDESCVFCRDKMLVCEDCVSRQELKEKIERKISEIEAQIPDDIGEHVVGYDKQLGALEAYREMLKEV